jgi:hypothetical protein
LIVPRVRDSMFDTFLFRIRGIGGFKEFV